MRLAVSEVFGPTFQGEGASAGRRCLFLRLAGCNLSCRWCDTPYTWDWSRFDRTAEVHPRTVEDVAGQIMAHHDVDRLVVTGGEPLLQARALSALLRILAPSDLTVEVETAGTLSPGDLVPYVDVWNVSPKLATSGNELDRRRHPEVLREFAALDDVCWKFVCGSDSDVAEAIALLGLIGVPRSAAWIQPEGATTDDWLMTARLLAPRVLQAGMNMSARLHTMLWGDARGR